MQIYNDENNLYFKNSFIFSILAACFSLISEYFSETLFICFGTSSETLSYTTFEQQMNLQGGEYLLSFGCTGFEADSLCVYHRLYDVTHIGVISSKNSIGFFDMNSKVELLTKEG